MMIGRMISTISEMIYVVPYPKSDDALGAHRHMVYVPINDGLSHSWDQAGPNYV